MKSINRVSYLVLALLLCAAAPAASAHGTIPGINQFYNGVMHPFLAPAHLLSLLALALLAGQQGLRPRPFDPCSRGRRDTSRCV